MTGCGIGVRAAAAVVRLPRSVPRLCTILLLVLSSDAFNLDVRHAEIIADPSGCFDTLFGLSVALSREGNGTWVLVGAPRGGRACRRSVKDPVGGGGVVYMCRTDGTTNPCSPIPFPENENCANESLNIEGGALAGWALDVQDTEDGRIVVCTSQWRDPQSQCAVSGMCFVQAGMEKNAKVLTPFNTVYPTIKEDLDDYAFPSTTFSAHFVKHSPEIIIGAPGAHNSHGTVVMYRGPLEDILAENSSTVVYSNIIAPKPFIAGELNSEPLFGYSISSGRFSRSNKTLYVSSAPRSNSLMGKVFIFDFPESSGKPIIINHELVGTQIGEYFGHCVCVVDLNSDGLDDLIIGAPYHSLDDSAKQSWDEGRVYVFMNHDGVPVTETALKIMGNKQYGARFGTSVTSIGDLNIDGFPDVAVGAPYEDLGHGAVYIYHGSRDGINPQYVQQISALEMDHSLLGFGISISRGLDMDGNHYNDIAVGAHISGHVVILKSRPIIRFRTSLTSNIGKMDVNAVGFLRACINYTGIHAPLSLVAAIILTSKSEANELKFVSNHTKYGNFSYFRELMTESSYCDRFGLEITEVSKGSSRPTEIKMEFKIALNGEVPGVPPGICLKRQEMEKKNGCLPSPMTDPVLPNSYVYKLPQPPYCGEDHICTTDIKSRATLSGVILPLVIGPTKILTINVLIKNNGGPASLVQARVIFPRVTPLKRIPHICQEFPKPDNGSIESLLVCGISDLMNRKETRHLHLVFDVTNIPCGYDRLVYQITSTSAGEDMKPENNDQELVIPLRTISDISISGKPFQDSVHFYRNNNVMRDTISFVHVYEGYTLGPSPLQLARFIFKVPTTVETSSGTEKFLKVYHPQINDGYPSILCTTGSASLGESRVLPHKEDTNTKGDMKLTYGEKRGFQKMIWTYSNKARKKRIKRELEDEEEEENYNYLLGPVPMSRAFVADCRQPSFKCTTLLCVVGPINVAITRAVITIPMELYPVIAEKVLKGKDVMILHSSGRITAGDISYSMQPDIHEPDSTNVSTVFFGKYQEFRIDSWILLFILSGGIMALFIMIVFLFKAGFFDRPKKRELELLKLSLKISKRINSQNSHAHTTC